MLILEGISYFYKMKLLMESYTKSLEKWQIHSEKHGFWQSSRENFERKKLPPLLFQNYENKFTVSLKNTGQTVQLDLNFTDTDCQNLPIVSGGPFDCDYTLDNIHLRWNTKHTVDGKRYPLEAHLVHYKTSKGSLQNAIKFDDGLAILAVCYDLGNCSENVFKTFVEDLEDISQNIECEVPVNGICFCAFLPKHASSYFTYEGVFDAPGIREPATWVVFSEPAVIARNQLDIIRNVKTEEDCNEKKEEPDRELNSPNVIYSGTFYADVRKFIRDTRRYIWSGH